MCLVGISWPDCSTELIADEHDIAHVSCFTVNPRLHCMYQQILQKLHSNPPNIGGAFNKVKPDIPLPPSVPKLLDIQQYYRSTALCPLCASPGHTHINCLSAIHICRVLYIYIKKVPAKRKKIKYKKIPLVARPCKEDSRRNIDMGGS